MVPRASRDGAAALGSGTGQVVLAAPHLVGPWRVALPRGFVPLLDGSAESRPPPGLQPPFSNVDTPFRIRR